MATQSIEDYILQVRYQRAFNPLFPKAVPTFLNAPLPYSLTEAIAYLNNQPFQYVACTTLTFSNTAVVGEGEHYWEFVDYSVTDFYRNLRYLYIKATPMNYFLVGSKVPTITTWDVKNGVNGSILYPRFPSFTEEAPPSLYYVPILVAHYHPFFPTFTFTGYSSIQKLTPLYEYIDTAGYFGQQDLIYYSPFRPIGLHFSLGVPDAEDMEDDLCFTAKTSKYSSTSIATTNGTTTTTTADTTDTVNLLTGAGTRSTVTSTYTITVVNGTVTAGNTTSNTATSAFSASVSYYYQSSGYSTLKGTYAGRYTNSRYNPQLRFYLYNALKPTDQGRGTGSTYLSLVPPTSLTPLV